MGAEERKILEMLAKGTIAVDEAEQLLAKVAGNGGAVPAERKRPGNPRYLRVVVHSTEGDNVNIRVPLALVRLGLKLTTVIPSEVTARLAEEGLDLSQLSSLRGEDLIESLRELEVDVESGEGETVKVFCE